MITWNGPVRINAARRNGFLTERLSQIEGIVSCDTFLILEVLMGLRGEWRDIASVPIRSLQEHQD